MATGSEDGTVNICDLNPCVLLKTFSAGTLVDRAQDENEFNVAYPVKTFCFSSDGSIMAYAGRNSTVSSSNLNQDELLKNFAVPARVTALASSDTQPLIAIAIPNKVLIYNIMEDSIISEFAFSDKKKEAYCYTLVFDGNDIVAGLTTGKILRLEIIRK